MDVKEVNTETNQAMELAFPFWTTTNHGYRVALVGGVNDFGRIGVRVRVEPGHVDD
jgi:hypothetical protein